MVRESEIRPSEVAVPPPDANDAGLVFIGRIRTPWTSRMETPRQGRQDGPVCRLELFEPWAAALAGLERYQRAEVIYWLHLSRRDLVLQSPGKRRNGARHVLAPLPGAAQPARHVHRADRRHRGRRPCWSRAWTAWMPRRSWTSNRTASLFTPLAPAQPGDFQTRDRS